MTVDYIFIPITSALTVAFIQVYVYSYRSMRQIRQALIGGFVAGIVVAFLLHGLK